MVARIPVGMRAFAVEVNEQTGVSGFIMPDHRVDVIQIEPGTNGKTEAETILQDVLVLASGQSLHAARGPLDPVADGHAGGHARARSTSWSRRRRKGPLSLALRGLNDHLSRPKRGSRWRPKPRQARNRSSRWPPDRSPACRGANAPAAPTAAAAAPGHRPRGRAPTPKDRASTWLVLHTGPKNSVSGSGSTSRIAGRRRAAPGAIRGRSGP